MKKKYQAVKADVGDYKGVRHDGKEYRFKQNDTFIIEDEGLAKELDFMYGKKGTRKLAISPYDDHETRELGHCYKFANIGLREQMYDFSKDPDYERVGIYWKKKNPKKRVTRRNGAEVQHGI